MVRTCPKGGLVNAVRLLAGCAGTVIGVVVGVTIAVPQRLHAASQAAEALRQEGQHVCGLIILGPLFEGVVVGTALGGPAGLVVSLLLGWLGARWWARVRTRRGTGPQ